MKFCCIFLITFWCTLYISEKSTAMRDENFIIQPADEEFNDIIEKSSETDTSDMQRNDRVPFSEDENVVIHPDDEAFTLIPETVSSDMQRKGKKNKKPNTVRNCIDLKKQGKSTGTYLITPCDDNNKVVKVYCDMDSDRGGWTVIQHRDYPPNQEFNNTWYEYAIGFGDVSRDFWLGNDNIHCLTKQSQNEIRFDLDYWNGTTGFANYGFFYVDDQTHKYKMEAQNYTGNVGDRFSYHSNASFSTFDQDNDRHSSGNCASWYGKGGWWFGSCYHTHLNGAYNRSVWWNAYVKKSEMKIRPRH